MPKRRATGQNILYSTSVTIASGSADSNAIDVGQLVKISVFRSTGTFTASRLGFAASRAINGTYKLVYDPDSAGNPLLVVGVNSTTIGGGCFPAPNAMPLSGLFIKFRKLNATTTAVVNQTGGAVVLGVVGKG